LIDTRKEKQIQRFATSKQKKKTERKKKKKGYIGDG
jgi:hypothetical protein